MSINNILSAPTSTINTRDWEVRLRPEYKSNLNLPSQARKHPEVVASLLELRNMAEFANLETPDEIFSELFGVEGIQIDSSVTSSILSVATRGDIQTLTATMNGNLVSVVDLINSQFSDISIEMLTTSKLANLLQVGKNYFSSLPVWTVHYKRNVSYASLAARNPNFNDDYSSSGYRATSVFYEDSRNLNYIADVQEVLVIGKLIDADIGFNISTSIQTGTLKFTGKAVASYKPIIK